MAKVLITGSGGVIGRILSDKLPHDTTNFDLPDHDVSDLIYLREKMRGHEVVVHLAWDKSQDDWLSENFDPHNMLKNFNVYEAAVQAGVKRVIVASSVHADKFAGNPTGSALLRPYDLPTPDSPYGAGKCMIEALGRYYADAKGLEVICIRFGGVNSIDEPPTSPISERQVWFSQRDMVGLLTACVEAPTVPNNYVIAYGVSGNEGRLHDYTNPFGWVPNDGAPTLE